MKIDCSIKRLSVSILLAVFIFFQSSSANAVIENTLKYNLAVSFDINESMLRGTARIIIPAGKSLQISLEGLTPTGVLLHRSALPPGIIETENSPESINILSSSEEQELFISYTKTIHHDRDNFITPEGITLLHSWYPLLPEEAFYTLSAKIPPHFLSISESDSLQSSKNGETFFSFSKATDSLHFIAAPFIRSSIEIRPNLNVYAYFLQDDKKLTQDYLENAKNFILRYEKIFGPYPYNHFAIVENHRPTGFGMPTFTLLGKNVIRLPFIKDTSLGHEIVHSWFGNSVRVRSDSGNWSEGLTSYFSDWLYRQDQNEGPLHRKENVIKYFSLVDDDTAIPLNSFRSASNYQHNANALRSVGYIRGAMLFHELKLFIGTERFHEGIRLFYKNFQHSAAGWNDIQATFEEVYGGSLESFFKIRLDTIDIPDISLEKIDISSKDSNYSLELSVKQKNETAYDFILPIKVVTAAGSNLHYQNVSQADQKIILSSDLPPVTVILDPEYDLLRSLSDEENEPTWSIVMGQKPAVIIIEDNKKDLYSPFLEYFSNKDWPVRSASDVKNSELKDTNLIFLGTSNSHVRSLFGTTNSPDNGLSIDIKKNPLNIEKVVTLISATSKEEVLKALRKLRHYGKYSSLHFRNGIITSKQFFPGSMGKIYNIGTIPAAIASRDMLDIDSVIKDIKNARAVYLGEMHSSMTDHYLQLLIIRKIYEQNKDIAIGLEMFPKSSQQSLDDYTLSDLGVDETRFLQQSEYFKVWRFDYRYYKKIIDFAKDNKIKLVALNIDREIVNTVFRSGSTDSLTDEQLQKIPQERDLAAQGYQQRLQIIHGAHQEGGHGSGDMSGFIQAQAIWDEVMAENIVEFLRSNPEKSMIILAGSQHTRKDSGIPPRAARRMDLEQRVIESMPEDFLSSPELADYYIYVGEQTLPPAGKIGITLEEESDNDSKYIKILGLSPNSNAKESGLLPGDRLLSIDGFAVSTMEDIRIGMADKTVGDSVTVRIERKSPEDKAQRIEFTVELYAPEQPN